MSQLCRLERRVTVKSQVCDGEETCAGGCRDMVAWASVALSVGEYVHGRERSAEDRYRLDSQVL
jgi:hypothetical protein